MGDTFSSSKMATNVEKTATASEKTATAAGEEKTFVCAVSTGS